jgi:hypothetical protein
MESERKVDMIRWTIQTGLGATNEGDQSLQGPSWKIYKKKEEQKFNDLASCWLFGRFVWSLMDLTVLFFYCSCLNLLLIQFKRLFFEDSSVLNGHHHIYLLQYHSVAISALHVLFRVLKVPICCNLVLNFQQSVDWEINENCTISILLLCNSVGQGCRWCWWNFC